MNDPWKAGYYTRPIPIPPTPTPPTLLDAREYCPDVFIVSCFGPVGDDVKTLCGRSKDVSYERFTVFRLPGQSDGALWARVLSVVKALKDRYGYRQDVSVLFAYDVPLEHAARVREQDTEVNVVAWLSHMAETHKSEKVRCDAELLLRIMRPPKVRH